MRKFALFVGTMLFICFVFFGLARLASAHNFRSGDTVVIDRSETIDHSLFAAGKTIDISSEVNGDVFCAGQTITISGVIHGDVICAGQTVEISGSVEGDVRLVGQSVTVSAQVKGGATIGGQTFTLSSDGSINRDVSVGSATATFSGPVGRDIAAGGSDLILTSKVGRNVKAEVERISLRNGSQVEGNVEYTSKNKISKSSEALVAGKVTQIAPTENRQNKRGAIFGFNLAWFLYWVTAMVVTALTIVLLFPRLIHRSTDRLMRSPWASLLTGFVASIVMPVLLVLLAATVIGLPLAVILGLSWLVVFLLSGPVSAYFLGRKVLRGPTYRPLLILLTGAALLAALYFIPIIGFLILLVAFWLGAGTILMELFDHTPKPHYSREPVSVTTNRVKTIRKK